MRFEDLQAEALKLSTEEREKLVKRLILSLDQGPEPDPELEQVWAQEAERRYQEFLHGREEAIPAEEVFRAVRAAL